MLEDSEDPVGKTVQPTIKTGRKWKVIEAVHQAKERLEIKEVIEQTQTAKGWGHLSKVMVKSRMEKRKEAWSSIRYGSVKIPDGFRKQSSNRNRGNGQIGIMLHLAHGTTSDQTTISCPQMQIWYGGKRKRTPLDRYAKADSLQSMS